MVANVTKRGVPAVYCFTHAMREYKEQWSANFRVPDARAYEIDMPSPQPGDVERIARGVIPLFLEGLTTPLTEAEKTARTIPKEQRPRIAFTGSEDDARKFFEGDLTGFVTSGPIAKWTDGGPIILPTEARVAEMLMGTSHKPDEVIGVMAPGGQETTVEKVAINAVMAGCKPEYMPVVLAGAELLCGEGSRLSGGGAAAIRICVSGPMSKEIGMEWINIDGTGNPANVTIMRAVRLVYQNCGGASGLGSRGIARLAEGPLWSAYAENIEQSPWQSLGEDAGFKPGETVVAFVGANNPNLSYVTPGVYRMGDPWLERTAWSIVRLPHWNSRVSIQLTAAVAQDLAAQGWDKDKIKKWLVENTYTPCKVMKEFSWGPAGWGASVAAARALPDDQKCYYWMDTKTFEPTFDTDKIEIIVTGGEQQFCTIAEGPQSTWKNWVVSADKWR